MEVPLASVPFIMLLHFWASMSFMSMPFIPFMSMQSCMPFPSIFMLPMSPDWANVAAEKAKAAISVAVETSFMMSFLF